MNSKIKLFSIGIAIAIILSAGLYLNKETKTQKDVVPESNNAGNSENKSQDIVTVRYLSSPGSASPIEFAKELGYFKDLNVIDAGTISGGPEGILSVASGSSDIGSGTAWAAIINAKARGTKVIGFAAGRGTTGDPFTWLVLENSSIQNANDLVGKKIATNTLAGTGDFVTREYLARNGISKEQVQIVVVPTTSYEQVLREKQADVVAGSGATIAKIIQGGGVRILFTDYDVVGDKMATVYPISEKFLKEKPDAAKQFVGGYVKAIDWARDNPKEAKELYAKILKGRGGNPELAKSWKGFGAREHALLEDGDAQIWIDWMVKDGIIKEGQIKPSDIYTNEYNPYYTK